MSPPLTTASLLGTPGVIGVYNDTGLLRCSDFRNDSTKNFFRVWPEDVYNFSYCCEDGSDHQYNLFNFTYSKHGARIISRPYFDLGYVETLLSPYWKQWRFWQVPQRKIVLQNFNCDFTDLHHLYTHRFWTKVMRDGTVLALKLILLLQCVVIAFVVLKWFWNVCCHVARTNKFRQKGGRNSSPSKESSSSWSNFIHTKTGSDMRRWWFTQPRWEDWFSDLLHMYLIVVVGGCLIEGTGHSDPTKWRAIILYNTAVVYAWMTLLCLISTVLRQVTVSWFDESEQDDEMEQQRRRETYKKKKEKSTNPNQLQLAAALQQEARPNHTLLKITEDWRWQRVFGQLAVLILIGTYLMFVDDDSGSAMDNIAALMFAAIVVACMWSGGVGLVVTARAIAHISRYLFYPPKPPTGEDLDIEKEMSMSMVFYPPPPPPLQQLYYQQAAGNLYPPPPPPINYNNNNNDGAPLYQGAANRRGSR